MDAKERKNNITKIATIHIRILPALDKEVLFNSSPAFSKLSAIL
tara:strand:+ start:79 stop:210 length:132 start_codon:yes stop_codon:yes gene_type:complete